MRNIFSSVGGLRPGRSVFDLSYAKLFDCYAGQLVPVMCDEVIPGDYFSISNEVIVRMQPLVAPMLHPMNVTVHYFFVPYRLLWDDWESFITGGEDGTDASVLPRWDPGAGVAKGGIWDYLGFPIVRPQAMDRPLIFPARAYLFIWNEYYRDENLSAAVDISAILGNANYGLYKRCWRKDYFTSALEDTQRGTAPALPITGHSHAVWDPATFPNGQVWADTVVLNNAGADPRVSVSSAQGAANLLAAFNANQVDLSAATTFTITDLRLTTQVQKFLERNQRAGVRYTEFLREHYGVSPRDERLQRPEYIGGSKQPLIVSEVLKTAEDGAHPQGNMAGHGLSASVAHVARYHAKEFGLIMGIMSIMAEPIYNSQGFDRQWLRRSRYDFPFPEFAHLSEQGIEREEIYATGVEADNRTLWGYQGRYNELRVKRSCVANNMRDTLNYWHMARSFAAAPALNEAFVQYDGKASDQTRIFADDEDPGFIVHFGNVIKASRPIPYMAEPGLMDHF